MWLSSNLVFTNKERMACILFVDDDYYTLETYGEIISFMGHQAILTESAERAFQILDTQLPDLIVVDMYLPDMDGFAFLKHLRADSRTAKIPAVMVSANPDIYARRAIEAGAQHYMSKPIYPEKLLAILEENREI
jgi:CheY-like chemotaxis protein